VCRLVAMAARRIRLAVGLAAMATPSATGAPFTIVDAWDTWEHSRAHCKRWGGDLAKIDSADKLSQLLETWKAWQTVNGTLNQGRLWIGAKDVDELRAGGTPGWRWISDGSRVEFTDWSEGEPNGPGKERCVFLNMPAGHWYDGRCDGRNAFVCEMLSSSPSSRVWEPPALPGKGSDKLRTQQLEACKRSRLQPADGAGLQQAEAAIIFLTGLASGVALVVCSLGAWFFVSSRLLRPESNGRYAAVGRSPLRSRKCVDTAEDNDNIPLATL